jgi:formimidoylglutamate deiminase
LAGGTQAAGGSQGELAIGKRADLLVIDPSHSALLTDADDGLLDAVVFQSGGRRAITRVMAGGAWRVEGGRHVEQRDLAARYRAAIQPLRPHLVS